MNVLYIYRNPKQGPSIRRVFEPIERELCASANIQSISLPASTASFKSILSNIKYVFNYLNGKDFEVIHLTGDVYYLMWILARYNSVVTVHDLLFYTRMSPGIKKILMYFLMIFPLRFTKVITFISEKSREEALSLFSLNENKCFVVNNPVNPSYSFCDKQFDMQNPLLLHLGTKPNKNLSRVIESIAGMKCKLHIVGRLSEKERKLIDELHLDVMLSEKLSDDEIREAYKNCDIVCFPSLYEGFGMPIVEAQAIGRPVVTSDLSPMNRVAGNGAVLVDPLSTPSIREGIECARTNYQTLIKSGIENVKRFSVKNIANQYLEIYKRLTHLT